MDEVLNGKNPDGDARLLAAITLGSRVEPDCPTCGGDGAVYDEGDREACYPPGMETCPDCGGCGVVPCPGCPNCKGEDE
jgi:DnaJ-class molecular chaperone